MSYSVRVSKERKSKPEWLLTESPQIKNFDILIGWDSEFYPDEENEDKMKILSYQFAAYYQKKDQYIEKIIYTSERKTLQEMLADLMTDLGISQWEMREKKNGKKTSYFEILLVAHYSKAEWSMLKNRHLIIKNLTEIQGTLNSSAALNLTIPYKGRNQKINVSWKDIYLFTEKKGRSLKSISQSCFNRKIEIPIEEKERMNVFLVEKEKDFAEYAINDARITLEYYCKYMKDFYENSKVEEIPLTLGDASVKWYIKHLEEKSIKENKETNGRKDRKWYEKKVLGIEWTNGQKRQKIKNRWIDEWFANNTYNGGINTSYYIGKFSSPDHWILDIDIANCYPTSLAVQPIIDWSKGTKKQVLEDTLREKARVSNKTVDVGLFAISEFAFPEETFQTSFPIPNDKGLIYTTTGRDIYTTYPEMVTAISQNVNARAEEVRIFEELKDENNKPMLAFADFLKHLIENRKKYKKTEPFKANIFKQMYLSFYGKLGQGITERYVYNVKREKKKMKKSKVSVPHYASTCTSLVRSVMVEMINYFQEKKFRVLNATTDGMMIAIPKEYFPSNFEVKVDENGKVDCENISFERILPNFYKDLCNKYAIRYLIEGRKNLEQDTNWIEIKHFGDLAHTWKTRVNCIVYKGITQHIARESAMDRNIKTYEDILQYDKEETNIIENKQLASVEDILNYGCDLVYRSKIKKAEYKDSKKINLDFDYKRELLGNETKQFKNIEEWAKKKEYTEEIKRAKKRATKDLIKIKEVGIQTRGSIEQIVTRRLLKEIFKVEKTLKNKEVREKLTEWKKENYPQQKWEINENLIKKARIKEEKAREKLPNTEKITKQFEQFTKILKIEEKKAKIIKQQTIKDN